MSPRSQPGNPSFGNDQDLLSRLSNCQHEGRSVVFLVGAPLSAPTPPETRGVPGVTGMIGLIRARYQNSPSDLAHFEAQIENADNRYQSAFAHLILRRGQDAANALVRDAVLLARASPPTSSLPQRRGDELRKRCEELEYDDTGWILPSGCAALGELAARSAPIFGRCILTTNFDPLLQVAVRRARGQCYRTVLDRDGHLGQTDGDGCHIVHLHGHWHRADMLHTDFQLKQSRHRLAHSLRKLLGEQTVVVLAYGGWDDIFNQTLRDILLDDGAHPDVLWTFHVRSPEEVQTRYAGLLTQLKAGMDRGRINLYHSVDVNQFLPNLLSHLYPVQLPSPLPPVAAAVPFETSSLPNLPPSLPITSPFRDIGRLTDPNRFFDREELLAELFAALRIGQNISLVGEAGIGKSSILTMIKHWGPGHLGLTSAQIIDIDMQLVDSERDFYYRLCRQMGIDANTRGRALAEQIEGKKFIVCIDEIEKMSLSGKQGKFGHKVRTHLRGLADGADRPLTLVVASRRSLDQLFPDEGDQTSPLYNICFQLPVRGFLPERAREFLRRRLSTTVVTFSVAEEEQLIEQSQGHPGQLQRMADALFAQHLARQ